MSEIRNSFLNECQYRLIFEGRFATAWKSLIERSLINNNLSPTFVHYIDMSPSETRKHPRNDDVPNNDPKKRKITEEVDIHIIIHWFKAGLRSKRTATFNRRRHRRRKSTDSKNDGKAESHSWIVNSEIYRWQNCSCQSSHRCTRTGFWSQRSSPCKSRRRFSKSQRGIKSQRPSVSSCRSTDVCRSKNERISDGS